MKSLIREPKASSFIQSLRELGYSIETAIADIIDNSISAKSTKIDIFANSTKRKICILDNGHGMDYEELLEAMRPASKNPLNTRDKDDLGRFGLGLKTASFSQCRKLTVASMKDGNINAAMWDLDVITETDNWTLQVYNRSEIKDIPNIKYLTNTGTLVLWEELDRLIESNYAKGDDFETGVTENEIWKSEFNDAMVRVGEHLQLVFHRYLKGNEYRVPKTIIRLNNLELSPFDPFNESHPATIHTNSEYIGKGDNKVKWQLYTLPHSSKLDNKDWELYGGKDGYVKNQGFYVYRQKRLIMYGTWFGLTKQTELTKLARVKIDIPNNLDLEWKIELKKSTVQLPVKVKERFRKIIEKIGFNSKRVSTHRGRRLTSNEINPIWIRLQKHNQITYSINKENPIISEFLSEVPESHSDIYLNTLKVIEASLPFETIYSDMAESPKDITPSELDMSILESAFRYTYNALKDAGKNHTDIEIYMKNVHELFKSNWQSTEKLLDGIKD